MIIESENYDILLNNDILISFVVPVYKVEKELARCVDSIVNQTYENIEVILVDDGGADLCPFICDEYSKRDSRVKTIHKENGGLSDARNAGLKEATGKYIFFVDSDDEVELDTCECFLKLMVDDIDIIVGEAIQIEGNDIKLIAHNNLKNNEIYSAVDYISKTIKKSEWYAPSCFNAYRREFLVRNELYFVKNLLHEDLEYMFRSFMSANRIAYIKKAFYKYYIRRGSITQTGSIEKNGYDLIRIYNLWMERIEKVNEKELKRLLYAQLIKMFIYTCKIYDFENPFSSLVTGIDRKFILTHCLNFREWLKAMLFCINTKLCL